MKKTLTMGMKGPNAADKFSELFDKDWKKMRSTLRARTADDRSYDPSYSWDGKSDDPISFSRMQATEMPVQPTRPVTLSGGAVIQLDHTPGAFLNPTLPGKTQSQIPLTCDQRDLKMTGDLSGKIPLCRDAFSSNKVVVVDERPKFSNMEMQPPSFRAEPLPEYIIAAGPQADQCLLNPAQRRGILEFEMRKRAADDIIRTATAAREKTRKQMSGLQFQRGILMVDSSHNEESEIYGESAKKTHADKQYKSQIHLERRSTLSKNTSSMATNGNILVPESVAPRVKTTSFYQSKGGSAHAFSFEETHNRLFCRQERAPNGTRTQRIRDAELGGKQFNIVNHTTIEHWPSRHYERLEDKNMTHPSQTSLEGTRNLQGSIRQY